MRPVLLYLASILLAVALFCYLAFDVSWFARCFSAQAADWTEHRIMGRHTQATAYEVERACHGSGL